MIIMHVNTLNLCELPRFPNQSRSMPSRRLGYEVQLWRFKQAMTLLDFKPNKNHPIRSPEAYYIKLAPRR